MTAGDEDQGGNRPFERQLRVFGERVQQIRNSHGLLQQDLTDRAGISRPMISAIEGGKQNITLEVLSRLADALEVHWADLLDDRKAGPPQPRRQSVPFDQQLRAFGNRLYQGRVLQRLSQQKVTDRTGIGQSMISAIEDGKQNVKLETVSKLAGALHLHWADLLDDRRTNPPLPVDSPEC